jgi:hypothetical protein
MATAITEPANTNPDTVDWQAILAKLTKVSGGMMLARLTNFENTSEPQVAQGSRFEINGSYYEVTSNESITGWSGIANSTPCYIYAVPSGSTASFIFSATVPTYDTAKGGLFNGTHRAMWRLYRTSSTVYSNKQEIDNPVIIPVLMADPTTPQVGQMWIRGDL